MEGLQNPGVSVTSGPQRDHVEGVLVITGEEMHAGGQELGHTGKAKVLKKYQPRWTGKMAQQVRALGTLAEDLGSIPRTYMTDYNVLHG